MSVYKLFQVLEKYLATLILIKTKGFTEIDSPRKMACYAGVVPFKNKSGSSIFGKNRVSFFADKQLKRFYIWLLEVR
ncbi:transposase [Chishuiella sp.]|uniref:transposase n=1 Tax=Chishuiella sp. TaxID=1969467 RepID=UPI0028A5A1AD|nr:transposase [Chishuiella sp.]